jgi:hypothetical protein
VKYCVRDKNEGVKWRILDRLSSRSATEFVLAQAKYPSGATLWREYFTIVIAAKVSNIAARSR